MIEFDTEYEAPCNKDPLLSSVRGRWRMPASLQPADFAASFRVVEPSATFNSVLARLRAGEWRTPASFARHWNMPSYKAESLMYCLLRHKLIGSKHEYFSFYPARRQKP